MSHDIYEILDRYDEALNRQQKSVPQLPALFQPKPIAVLGAKTDPQHPMKGYAVGTSESAEETPEGEVVPIKATGAITLKDRQDYLDRRDVLYRQLSQAGNDPDTKEAVKLRLKDLELAAKNAGMLREEDLSEAKESATEDVLSSMKKKLGDYLQDVATAIKTDPDLKDKIPQTIDQIKTVKTIRTDDGHEIKITGNEDDGFRISIRNQEIKTPFQSLDEAVMACEMYCARRRTALEHADYIEERRP